MCCGLVRAWVWSHGVNSLSQGTSPETSFTSSQTANQSTAQRSHLTGLIRTVINYIMWLNISVREESRCFRHSSGTRHTLPELQNLMPQIQFQVLNVNWFQPNQSCGIRRDWSLLVLGFFWKHKHLRHSLFPLKEWKIHVELHIASVLGRFFVSFLNIAFQGPFYSLKAWIK